MKPLCIDLFCGLGGWAEGFLAEGYDVIGYDIDPRFAETYPATFIQADVRNLDGREFRGARCIVASPPCQEFSTAYWAFNPELRGEPDMDCVNAVWRIRSESGRPVVLENVRGARRWLGKSKARYGVQGSICLWGDVPPLVPTSDYRKGWRLAGPTGRPRRTGHPETIAKIPLPLARAIARGFL